MSKTPQIEDNYQSLASRRYGEYQRMLIVFMVAWIVRLIHILSLKASPIFFYKIGDAARYDAWARSLAEGNWLGEGVFYQAPLYPYFLGIIYSTLGDGILTVRLVQSLLGAASCVLLMLAATRFFGKKSGMFSGIGLALYAPSIFLEGLIQKSTLDLFFLCLILWLISKLVYRPKSGLWILTGVATGALCLTRENALVLLPVFLLWIVAGTFGELGQADLSSGANLNWIRLDWRPRIKWAIAFGFGLVLTLGPVAVRNYFVGGQFHLTTSQLGPNFYIGNNPQANGTYRPLRPGRGDAKFEQQDAVELAEQAMGKELSAKEVSRYYLDQSFQFIRQEPSKWLQLMALKFGMTFNRHEIIDTEDQYTVARLSPVLMLTEFIFNFGLLVPLGLFGILATRARWKRLWVVYLMMIAFAVTVVAFFVFGRYRFPLAPPLLLFLGPAWIGCQRLIQSRNVPRITCAFVGMALILVGCNLKLVSPENGRAITLSNYGVQALIRDDFDNAERYLTASIEHLPHSALVHNNMGVLYRETDRPEKALDHFRLAHELEPKDGTIRRNYERLLEGR